MSIRNLLVGLSMLGFYPSNAQHSNQTTLIQNVLLIDGTGKPAEKADLRIKNNQIDAIGNLTPQSNENIIDGKGQILAPGFIDTHSHHFGDLDKNPQAIPLLNQGITTIIIGQDGNSHSMQELIAFMKNHHVAVNIGTYTGHSTLRENSMGEKNLFRNATQQEIDLMKIALKKDLQAGSFGLSTGLEYEEAFFSHKDEVIQLAKETAAQKKRYISHIRSEDIKMPEALDEIIEIGRVTGMPVQISHIKIAHRSAWNKASQVIEKLETARKEGINITADIYPYTFWNSTLRVLFPSRDYKNEESALLATKELFDPEASVLVHFAPMPQYKGKTIAHIAAERNESTAKTLMFLIDTAASFKEHHPNFNGSIEAIAGKSMTEADVVKFLQWPYANICSDGKAGGHPRGYGAFTRFLGRYVLQQNIMPLETAIHRITGLAAHNVGITNRGTIKVGNAADLVLLDPKTVIDNATIENGTALSSGITSVWVNGKVVYQNQISTGNFSGLLIKDQRR